MKYLIITYDEYINIPYIERYETCLQQMGKSYDVIVWNRSGSSTPYNKANYFVFEAKNTKSKIGKIIPFIRWRKFVLQVMRRSEYERIIVLTTIPAVLLADQLLKKYAGRYWLDIRDYTFENIALYKKLVGQLARKSYVTSISSAAFASFLPEDAPIVLTHNLTNDNAEDASCDFDKTKACFSLTFVGGVRYPEQNKKLLLQLGNNPRYLLRYIGKTHPGCELQPFCQEHNIENVEFLPAYLNEQKPQLYQSIDLINSIYGNDSKVVTLALPNKLYDCVLFKKPILVSSGTYLAQLVQTYHLGLAVDIEKDDLPQLLQTYVESFDRGVFECGCKEFLEVVRLEQEHCDNTLERFLAGKEYSTTSYSEP